MSSGVSESQKLSSEQRSGARIRDRVYHNYRGDNIKRREHDNYLFQSKVYITGYTLQVGSSFTFTSRRCYISSIFITA